MNYPEHKHPHGIGKPSEHRIWVCEECDHIFTDEEVRKDEEPKGWGHPCQSHSHPCREGQRCESHLEPYTPELGSPLES